MGRSWEAVCALHEALAVGPQDSVTTDLLGRALEENASLQEWGNSIEGEDEEDRQFESFIGARREDARRKNTKGKGKRGGRINEVAEDSTMMMSDEEE